jgi:hypothetical protein
VNVMCSARGDLGIFGHKKLISRSIFGFELAIDAILSRSSVESERVGDSAA